MLLIGCILACDALLIFYRVFIITVSPIYYIKWFKIRILFMINLCFMYDVLNGLSQTSVVVVDCVHFYLDINHIPTFVTVCIEKYLNTYRNLRNFISLQLNNNIYSKKTKL